ncbi:leucyl/phenylalanyl-tRNA--protein transferase [Peredibacter starrii]|uniref:Leucyl/phenylalanyl-tRNA--protein transferase n=1 Tax=Peredibacter starrii TaxID=28202 RepID=A0AAX4HSD4_9BACT|nr:leucyl/phenylalanyl-tRNA--protein transferase [Peredibacter starrii]WPU66194.1 leucyl/phenylalanyl-tRNA--protein transferase [Peredibacter starrii]
MKRKIVFPPVDTANEDGLVAVGGDLEVDTLIEAYRRGIFPWPLSTWPLNRELPNTWFSPNPRGVLFFDRLHVSRSFVKFLKKTPYTVTFNQAFTQVIHNCAKMVRKDQPGTWITPGITRAYEKLFQQDLAYSVEVWDGTRIVGGLYGVVMGDFISGESMFTIEDNAAKQGFYTLISHLESKGINWIDTQMVTPVVEQFGGIYISRPDFLRELQQVDWTREKKTIF